MELKGKVTTKEEFIYPDSQLDILPNRLEISMAENGKPGMQILIEARGQSAEFYLTGEGFHPEWYEMRPVPVEYNTGDGVSQGGAMVLEDPPEEKPDYVTRLAPFWVFMTVWRRKKTEEYR